MPDKKQAAFPVERTPKFKGVALPRMRSLGTQPRLQRAAAATTTIRAERVDGTLTSNYVLQPTVFGGG